MYDMILKVSNLIQTLMNKFDFQLTKQDKKGNNMLTATPNPINRFLKWLASSVSMCVTVSLFATFRL